MNSINKVKCLAHGPDPITALLISVKRNHFALGDSKLHPEEDRLRPPNFDSLHVVTRGKHWSSVWVCLKWQLSVWERSMLLQ